MSKWIPDRKIWGGGLSALIAWVLVQAVQVYLGVTLPPGTDATVAAGIGFVAAYVLPPSAQDVIRRIDGAIVDLVAKDPSIPLTKAPAPLPPAKTTVVGGMSGRIVPLLALLVILPLVGACSSIKTVESAAPSVTSAPITQAVQTVKDMPPAEKWRLACLGVDGLYIGYVAMAAPKLSDATNVKVQASFEAVKVVCANQPADYASGLVTLMQAVNAFKAAVPAKAAI